MIPLTEVKSFGFQRVKASNGAPMIQLSFFHDEKPSTNVLVSFVMNPQTFRGLTGVANKFFAGEADLFQDTFEPKDKKEG